MSVGPQGPRGFTGAAGFDGVDGRQGPRGPQGENGQDGPPGPRGERGERGERGLDGSPGASEEYTNHLLSIISTLTAEQLRQRVLIDALTSKIMSLEPPTAVGGMKDGCREKAGPEKTEKEDAFPASVSSNTTKPVSPCHSHHGLVCFRQIASLPPDKLSSFDLQLLALSKEWLVTAPVESRKKLLALLNSFDVSFGVDEKTYQGLYKNSSFSLSERIGFLIAIYTLRENTSDTALAVIFAQTLSEILHFRGLENHF